VRKAGELQMRLDRVGETLPFFSKNWGRICFEKIFPKSDRFVEFKKSLIQ